MTMSENEVDDVEAAGPPGDPYEVARIVCLRLLDRRAYTRVELERALRKRDVPVEAGQRVLDRLAELRLIDDTALADGYARAQHQERGLSGRAVAYKLRQRGVGEQDVLAAVAQIDAGSERAAAAALVQRKLRSMAGLEPAARARRLVAMLARKGYAPGLAYEVVQSVVREHVEVEVADPFD